MSPFVVQKGQFHRLVMARASTSMARIPKPLMMMSADPYAHSNTAHASSVQAATTTRQTTATRVCETPTVTGRCRTRPRENTSSGSVPRPEWMKR